MRTKFIIQFIFFLLFCISIKSQELIQNMKYFDYFITKNILNDSNSEYLETQKVQKIDNTESSNLVSPSLHHYLFKISEPYTGIDSNLPKNAAFVKYRNFTIEKNFQIT